MYKVKLAAIAKDEAAYLPEWIFHHLIFGFDEIEIYINNTTDNSVAIVEKIAKDHPVKYKIADDMFNKAMLGSFQFKAYKAIAKQAFVDGFTHVLFLDIDEFWTPKNFNTRIQGAIEQLNNPQALCFEWAIHRDEEKAFSLCMDQSISVSRHDHIKTLFQTNAPWRHISCHNVIGSDINYTLADGTPCYFDDNRHRARVPKENKQLPLKDYFIMHRMFRSEMEYVSLLGRGRPSTKKVKNNRAGYYDKTKQYEQFEIAETVLSQYKVNWDVFVERCDLQHEIEKGQAFVKARYDMLVDTAMHAEPDMFPVFKKTLKNTALPDVQAALMRIEQLEAGLNLTHTLTRFPMLCKLMYVCILKACKLHNKADDVIVASSFFEQLLAQNEITLKGVESILAFSPLNEKKYPDAYRNIALSLKAQHRYKEAYPFIKKALKMRPDGTFIQALEQEIKAKL